MESEISDDTVSAPARSRDATAVLVGSAYCEKVEGFQSYGNIFPPLMWTDSRDLHLGCSGIVLIVQIAL
jgi:hypothetical protein